MTVVADKTVVETLLSGDKLYFEDNDKFFKTTFYHKTFPICIELKRNSHDDGEKLEYVNVSFYDRAVNACKHLKVYESNKGLYFMAYGKRCYINDMIRKY